jgi:hypothetical protein
MRTSITIDDDVHEFASIYATAKGITLSAAINELIRRAETAPEPSPDIRYDSDGFPMFPLAGRVVTPEMVKEIEGEEFDPKKFA